jgi:peptidyl-prolyl cis-trans isomerase D
MYDFVSKHKRVTQLVLALITLPFAFFGVDYYFRQGDTQLEVATVGGDKISQAEYADTIREQQERMRQQLGPNFDPAIFDNPEVRFALLEQLVNQRLLAGRARDEAFRVPDAQLQAFIAEIPAFQDGGRFSPDRYRQVLGNQNMTPAMFEARLRRELTLAPLQEAVALGNIVARSSGERLLGLLEQRREVAVYAIDADAFVKDVKVDDAAVKAFYDSNEKLFLTPELVKFEYLVLTPDALAGQATVEPAEVKAHYDANVANYGRPEERSASHILITVKPDAKEEEKAAARKRAEDLLAQASANPARFAELAKQFSQDSGSAGQGGDLGSFPRGAMVKPFEDAVFGMKVGEIAGPVQSDFGYHVIKLTAIAPGTTRPFDEVKGQIEADLKRQRAAQKFAAAADQFQNLVYEQADSLQGVAKALNLPVQTSPLVTRTQAQALAQGSAKFVQALFSAESLQGKRNTEAIEIGPNALMAGRVVEFKASAARPFDEVRDEIRRQLVRKAASEMALQAGREKLALLEQGKVAEAGATFAKPVTLTRNQAQPGFPPDALTRIFQVDPAKLPQFVGNPNERGGFSIYRVEKVIAPPAPEAERVASANAQIGEQLGRELFAAYLGAMKAKTEVRINQANLEKK